MQRIALPLTTSNSFFEILYHVIDNQIITLLFKADDTFENQLFIEKFIGNLSEGVKIYFQKSNNNNEIQIQLIKRKSMLEALNTLTKQNSKEINALKALLQKPKKQTKPNPKQSIEYSQIEHLIDMQDNLGSSQISFISYQGEDYCLKINENTSKLHQLEVGLMAIMRIHLGFARLPKRTLSVTGKKHGTLTSFMQHRSAYNYFVDMDSRHDIEKELNDLNMVDLFVLNLVFANVDMHEGNWGIFLEAISFDMDHAAWSKSCRYFHINPKSMGPRTTHDKTLAITDENIVNLPNIVHGKPRNWPFDNYPHLLKELSKNEIFIQKKYLSLLPLVLLDRDILKNTLTGYITSEKKIEEMTHYLYKRFQKVRCLLLDIHDFQILMQTFTDDLPEYIKCKYNEYNKNASIYNLPLIDIETITTNYLELRKDILLRISENLNVTFKIDENLSLEHTTKLFSSLLLKFKNSDHFFCIPYKLLHQRLQKTINTLLKMRGDIALDCQVKAFELLNNLIHLSYSTKQSSLAKITEIENQINSDDTFESLRQPFNDYALRIRLTLAFSLFMGLIADVKDELIIKFKDTLQLSLKKIESRENYLWLYEAFTACNEAIENQHRHELSTFIAKLNRKKSCYNTKLIDALIAILEMKKPCAQFNNLASNNASFFSKKINHLKHAVAQPASQILFN